MPSCDHQAVTQVRLWSLLGRRHVKRHRVLVLKQEAARQLDLPCDLAADKAVAAHAAILSATGGIRVVRRYVRPSRLSRAALAKSNVSVAAGQFRRPRRSRGTGSLARCRCC